MPYDAVVFDFDGVIMDLPDESFNEHMEDVVATTLEQHAIDETHPAYEQLYSAMFDRSMEDIEATADAYGLDYDDLWATKEAVSFKRQRKQIDSGERAFYEDITALPELADHCDIAVFSNNQHEFIAYALAQRAPPLNGTGSLDTVMTTYYGIQPTVDDHFKRKPDPAYIEHVQEELDADQMLYVGDKAADIMAAHRAGVDSAFVQRSHNSNGGEIPTDENGQTPTYGPITELDELTEIVRNGKYV